MNSIETKSSHFFGMYCNKFWETFTNRTASRQVKSRISKALTKIQKTLFGANYLVDSNEMKCSCFVDMYCNKLWAIFTNKTVYARLDIWNQVFTKTLTKLQKTLIGVKYLTNSNETKCFRFLEHHCNKVWAVFTNWIVSWNGRSSIHKNPHKNPENIDRSKTLGQFQPNKIFSLP